jgi:hypothetical protein
MALPYIFASVTTIATPQFDANFAALGALTPIPCSVTGTNALGLTPLANTPTVPAYQNYMQFTGVAANTSSGTITAQVGSLAALNVYVDTAAGLVQASTGQIVQNTSFTLMYDSTLNTGSGGFHLLSAVVVGSFLPLAGGTLSGALVGTSVSMSGALKGASVSVTGAVSAASVTCSTVSAATIAAATKLTAGAATVSGNATVGGNFQIATGNPATRMLWTTATLAFGALTPQTSNDQAVTLSGVQVGDTVMAGVPSAPSAGLVFFPFCATASTVTLRAFNGTTATVTPPSGVYEVTAIGFT